MSERAAARGLWWLLAVAATQYLWNAAAQPGFWGYDEGGHAGYALALREGGLPHPLSGWSSFHPPLAHALAALVWTALEPLGPRAALAGMRAVSGFGVLLAGACVFPLARRLGAPPATALSASALALFVPVAQLSASMLGNEGLLAGLCAAALLAVVELHEDPTRRGAAARAGILTGLALLTKYSGAWLLAACALPFLRRDLGRSGIGAAALCLGSALLLASPLYLRNLALTGTPVPMTRELEPMRSQEARLYAGPRRPSDYLRVPWDCGLHPYAMVVVDGRWAGVHEPMRSVPCAVYTGAWFDAFGLRVERQQGSEGIGWATALLTLGVVPTLLLVLGFGLSLWRAVRSGGRAREAPLVAMSLLGAASFAAFTWIAPSLAAVKAAYLLPLLAPAGAFFGLGAALLGSRVRRAALAVSLAAAALAAWVFTTGAVFPPADPARSLAYWTAIGRQLPDSRVAEAASRLLGGAATLSPAAE